MFTDINVPIDFYKETLKRQAIVNDKITFVFKNQLTATQFETFEYCYENGIKDYVAELAGDGAFTSPQYWECERVGRDRDDLNDYKLKIKAALCFSLKTQLKYYTSGTVKEEYERLKNKCEAIEAFRNSFPYKIADGYILYNIMRTNLQVGKASTWQIVGDFNGDLWECSIVRPHTQSYKELLTLVASTKEPNEVGALNQSETLLWE